MANTGVKMANKSWSEMIRENKTLLLIVIIGFFLIEIEIFALATMRSGRQSWMKVFNDSGDLIYEVKGATLTNFNKYYFENTFGPLKDYKVKLETKNIPFPFRAWLSATIGIPVGLILLFAFILKSVLVMISGKKDSFENNELENDKLSQENQTSNSVAEKIFLQVSKLNIFIIGFIILSGVLLYWIVPNLLAFLAKAGIETLINFKWFFLVIIVLIFFIFCWFMYMKYQLAKKSLDAQTEIRKYELKLEYVKNENKILALEHKDTGVNFIEHKK